MISSSPDFIKTMLSPTKGILHIKIELYDSKYNYIKEITQQVDSDIGTLMINSQSPIRRSFSINLNNISNEFLFGEDNLVWIDKRLRLYIGLQLQNDEVEYVPQGVFVLTEPESNHSLTAKSASINAVDKAYFMTDKRGKFVNEQIVEEGVKITDAIRIIASHVGESMFNFDDIQDTVPYELAYSGDENRWNAIQELAEIAKCTIFYDVFGYLRLKKIDLNKFENEPITWEYKLGQREYAGSVRKFNDSNLANHIRVLGGSSDIAEVVYDLVVDENDTKYGHLWKDSPYSIQRIGRFSYFHNNNNPDGLIVNQDDALFRAKFELMNRLGFAEDVQISVSPNYLHDVDDVIWVEDPLNGLDGGKYLIKSINLPLSPALMTMDVVRYRKLLDDWNFIY